MQIEQERSEEESSVGDALALAFCCGRFCSASWILFAPYSPAPLLMRPRHFVRSCAICSQFCWYVDVFKGGFEGIFVSLLACMEVAGHHRIQPNARHAVHHAHQEANKKV